MQNGHNYSDLKEIYSWFGGGLAGLGGEWGMAADVYGIS